MHLNIFSLPDHVDNLANLLYGLDLKLLVMAITESRLTTKKRPKDPIKVPDYCKEHTPTKSEKDGALLYISKELNYKNRQNLTTNKDEILKSVFIKVLSK